MKTFFEILAISVFSSLFAMLVSLIWSMTHELTPVIYWGVWFASYLWASANLNVHTKQEGDYSVIPSQHRRN